MTDEPTFKAGDKVYAAGRVSEVEKVYANGNFKIRNLDGQWRQTGRRAGDHGWTSSCVHYTEEVAAQVAREAAIKRLRRALLDFGGMRYLGGLDEMTIEQIEAITADMREIQRKLTT